MEHPVVTNPVGAPVGSVYYSPRKKRFFKCTKIGDTKFRWVKLRNIPREEKRKIKKIARELQRTSELLNELCNLETSHGFATARANRFVDNNTDDP